MASIPSPANRFLFSECCPQALKDWIEQDLGWKAQDIREIEVEFQKLEGKYQKYGSLIKASVTREYLGVCENKSHQFLQFPNGDWHKFKGWMHGYGNDSVFPVTDWQIAYTPDFETKVQKQELDDNDAFDLMDSIRGELWK